MPSPLLLNLIGPSVALALVARQVFRRHEVYSLRAQILLLFVPPGVVALHATRLPSSIWTFFEAFWLSLAIYVAALLIATVVYRLSPWHPLATYPGPALRKVSELVSAYYVATGRKGTHLRTLHEQYGDIVRIGPNTLSIVDTSLMPHLWNVSRGPANIGIKMSYKNVTMMGIRDPEEHARRRRPWNRGLSQAAVKEYEQPLMARVLLLIRRLEEQKGEVNLAKWTSMFSMDFTCDMAFGGGTELLRDGEHTNPFNTLQKGMVLASVLAQVPWLGVCLGHIPGSGRPLRALHTASRSFAARRLKRGATTRDLFHYLNNEDLQDVPPPPQERLIGDAILAVVAGADTTSNTMVSMFYCLLANPAAYAALQAEVDKFYPPGDNPYDTKHYQEMHYLNAVINETIRLYHPTSTGGQRQVPSSGPPLVVGSVVIPPGTIFFMPMSTLHRDPRNFSYPSAFWPERWLIASGHISVDSKEARAPGPLTKDQFVHNDTAFITFGLGPLACVGKALANLQMRMFVCALLQKFEFQLRNGWDPKAYDDSIREYVNLTTPELPVYLRARW